MKIGFDLDKIFIDYPPFFPPSIIDKLYKGTVQQKLTYRIPKKPEQILRRLTHLPFFRPAIKKNMIFLQRLSEDKKNTYFLISSRFSFLKKPTEGIVKKYNFSNLFNGLHFNFNDEQPHIFKERIIKRLKLDIYVDDDLDLLEYLVSQNIQTKFFWLCPIKKEKINKKIHHIYNLSDILK